MAGYIATMASNEVKINTRKMRYTGDALAALRESKLDVNLQVYEKASSSSSSSDSDGDTELSCPSPGRGWLKSEQQKRLPQAAKERHIGTYALTTELSSWVKEAIANYQPSAEVLDLVEPFAAELHNTFENERGSSTGLHDIDAIELTYQFTVEVGAAILLAANATKDPVDLSMHTQLHASKAGGDDHFSSWGKLLTGLDCDPPIIVQFPFYLMMCQSFTFEPIGYREDYIYSALTGVDWAKGSNKFNDRLNAFKALALASLPDLDDTSSGDHTIGSAYMSRDGAAWLDNEGIDSVIGSALPNDVMDLHTDIFTGETRNLIRLLLPPLKITEAIQSTSTLLSSMLCEIFRGHYRARFNNREDGQLYIAKYPKFWDWTWEIYGLAKSQITEAAIAEPLVAGLKRAVTRNELAESAPNKFFHLWYDMVEDGSAQLAKKQPLGVTDDLAPVVRNLHSLWHQQLLDDTKQPGWGREFDMRSDALFSEAGHILAQKGGISEDMYKFSIAYGRLSMSLPYIAYHTVDAIILAFGAIPPV
ncbi:hypothetical protein INS49_015190 [Diaporthe citri]|uniref:uncharacterized protein n=1 Tax=Diaporthe citri TaxID=83186 RepID=UPI001C7EA12A|nr:uncharacterized protein INS49_015190 [Diaporthe citri]KAG6357312.1 hypothetical protein INS49_015190 [Diaporthe citri]